jgi:hypothetical protein
MTNLECPCRRGASGSYSGEGSLTQGLLCHSGAVQYARDILDRALGKPVPRTESSAAEVRSDDPVAEVARLELEVKRLTEEACLITGPPRFATSTGCPAFYNHH